MPNNQADDIIRQSVQGQFPPEQFMQALDEYLQQHPDTKLFPLDQAVFMISPAPKGGVEFHTFSANRDVQAMVGTYRKLADFLRNAGVKYAVTETTDSGMVRLGKMTGLPLKVTEKAVDEGRGPQPGFEIRVDF